MLLWWSIGILLALFWLAYTIPGLVGIRHIDDISGAVWDRPAPPGRVSIIVPACNEEEHVVEALSSLAKLDHPDYEVIALNDRSTDRTGELMEQIAARSGGRVRVVHINELPAGWLGKTHAMWTGAQHASGDWLLFTDADVVFQPSALRRAVSYAIATDCDDLLLFPTVSLDSVGKKMVMSFFFNMIIAPPQRIWKVGDARSRDYFGVGAFALVRRSTYDAIGTHERLRMEVIDDIKLGKLVKEAGFHQRVVFGRGLIWLHWGRGAMGVIGNLVKNTFAFLHYRWELIVGALLIGPVLHAGAFVGVLIAPGWAKLPFGVVLGAVALLYFGMGRYSHISGWYFVFHPIAAALFLYAGTKSAIRTLRDGGVTWRGTKYSLDELRKGIV